jgi:hypothetical protein
MIEFINKPDLKQGWLCPVCNTVNAPYMAHCLCNSTGKECKPTEHVWDIFEDNSVSSFLNCLKCGKIRKN